MAMTLPAGCASAPATSTTNDRPCPAFPVPPPEVIDDVERLTREGGEHATADQWERWWIDLERHATRLHGAPAGGGSQD